MNLTRVILSFLMCLQISASGETINNFEGVIEYSGNDTEVLSLEGPMTITRTRIEDQDSTCYRQEPYEEEVCGNETRYRNVCDWRPGRRVCDTSYDRVCRNVTRYRNSCTTGPSRNVCTNEPGRRVCRTRNGQQVCRDIPGRRVCRSKPGRSTCRKVPYTDRVCDRVPRTRCRDTPGRNVCTDVPYDEWVCKMVTKYRSVPYACTKPVEVPYEVEVNHVHDVKVKFSDVDSIGAGKLTVKVVEKDFVDALFENSNDEQSFIMLEKKTEVVSDEETEIKSETQVDITFGNLSKLLAPVKAVVEEVSVSRKGKMKINSDQASDFADSDIEVVIVKEKDNEVHFAKTFKAEDFNLSSDNEMTINLADYGFKKLKTFLGLGDIDLKVSLRVVVAPPKGLHLPIKDSLVKTHEFKVEAD